MLGRRESLLRSMPRAAPNGFTKDFLVGEVRERDEEEVRKAPIFCGAEAGLGFGTAAPGRGDLLADALLTPFPPNWVYLMPGSREPAFGCSEDR